MKLLNSLIGFLFLFVLTVLVMRSFNEYGEYRFEVLHLLLFVLYYYKMDYHWLQMKIKSYSKQVTVKGYRPFELDYLLAYSGPKQWFFFFKVDNADLTRLCPFSYFQMYVNLQD